MKVRGQFLGITTIDIQFILTSEIVTNRNNHANDIIVDIGGMATNAAITYKLLGGSATLFSQVGSSEFSNLILNKIKDYNVHHINLSSKYNHKSTVSAIITLPTGERTILTKYENNFETDIINFNPNNADIILVDNSSQNMLNTVLNNSNKNTPSVFDLDDLEYIDDHIFNENAIIIASENVYLKLDGRIQEFISKHKINKLAFTRGEKPILFFHNNEAGEIPVEFINSIDTLGAGDIFHGAFCYFYSIKQNFIHSLEQASKIATLSCKYYGTREWVKYL